MSIANKLRNNNRKVVELIHQFDVQTGEPLTDENGQPLKVTIRKVNASEVLIKAGSPMLLSMFGGIDPEESDEQRAIRMGREATQDPEKYRKSAEFFNKLVSITVCSGVVDVPIVDKHESELEEDEITPEMLGDDLPRVFNEIAKFSGIPYNAQEVAATQRFPKEQVAADPGQDGPQVRKIPEPVG